MKNFFILSLMASVLTISCKEAPKKEVEGPVKELSILEKIAYANGYENWKNVQELKFTFNVDRDTTHYERSWIWKPKANEVTAISGDESLTYNRSDMDSLAYEKNGGFINDKYWLMAPINILWDQNSISTEHSENVEAPISKKNMQKLTIVYGQEGGYTPGDAYDFYFTDDFMVKEWVFRKGNQEEPSMTTTWEDYQDKGGLKLAHMHQNEEGNFKLYFTGVEVN
ncbi:hypothetical protein [Euzebyella saccharophila]|uniref:Uncharacterized protein n=1 Tax=Euzebyella saccharophila TaxID=679664 RepID=A0ABV8JPP8_9FLAO|nr:hypothetical protein [Euzebyella saccharophila]